MNTKESIKNEIFTLESRELNEGKKVAFIAGAINRDIKKANVKAKIDRKSTRLNSSHSGQSRMPSSA